VALASGSSLGPYRILAPLGVGGMGEVYRAHDDRLDRDVALKVLPVTVAADPERLERFEREARASAALNHPNIVSVFDIGQTSSTRGGDATTYVVMELLEGATLRGVLETHPPTPRKALEWTVDVARGLAAAHARGIVHRDVKPDNLFVTTEGRIKILDFGIARFTAQGSGSATDAATVAAGTEPGKVMGTAGYMSPEQVRGEPIDARSDIFALGAVLYEMLAGRRAFAGETAVETMHAVLKTDPPEMTGPGQPVAPALDRIVRRCLEKRPEDRFHSAHDLALALEAVSGSHTQSAADAIAAPVRSRGRTAVALVAGALVLVAATAAAAAWWVDRDGAGSGEELPVIRQITVRRGTIDAARFTSGGDAVVYSARFAGAPPAPFTTHLNSPEVQQIGPDNAMLFSASEGALALGLAPVLSTNEFVGTLALLPPGASAAREIAPRVLSADFIAGGFAAIESTGNGNRLHVPVGTVVEESSRLRLVRAAPDGRSIAYVGQDGIVLRLEDGTRSVLVEGAATGLAWSPAGDRLWFSRATGRGEATIWTVAPSEPARQVWRAPGQMSVEDVAVDGRLLLRRDDVHLGTIVVTPDAPEPVDLSWLDRAQAVGLSAAAGTVLLNDAAGFYVRKIDGSPAVPLGAGRAVALSPGGDHVVVANRGDTFHVVPVGPGTPYDLKHPGVESYFAWFHPDGRSLLFNGREPGGTWRFFAMNLDGGGEVRKIGPDNIEHYIGQVPISNDARLLAGFPLPERLRTVYPIDGGDLIPIAGIEENEVISRFAEGDRELFVFNREGLPVRIVRVNYRTGERTLWREFMPGDPAGIDGIRTIVMSADGRTMAFNYIRVLSTLFEVSGLR